MDLFLPTLMYHVKLCWQRTSLYNGRFGRRRPTTFSRPCVFFTTTSPHVILGSCISLYQGNCHMLIWVWSAYPGLCCGVMVRGFGPDARMSRSFLVMQLYIADPSSKRERQLLESQFHCEVQASAVADYHHTAAQCNRITPQERGNSIRRVPRNQVKGGAMFGYGAHVKT